MGLFLIGGKIAHSGCIFVLELWYNKVAVIIDEYRIIGVMSAQIEFGVGGLMVLLWLRI